MATSPPPLPSIFLVLIIAQSVVTPPSAVARPHGHRFPTSRLTIHGVQRNSIAQGTSKAVAEGLDFSGVVRSSPAHPMPSYHQGAAPAPLPEFPTLGPPIVWSFPAAPLPTEEAPPPQDMPALPRTKGKHGPASPPCHGGHQYPHQPPSVPLVAAEPASWPSPLEAPESAPEPTAGGPSSPPY
eukprot:c23926_g1_i1 orf=38-586(+)